MYKSFQILPFYALLLVFSQSLGSIETENNQSQIQYKLNKSKNYSKTIEIRVDSKYHQDMVVGYKGSFIFTTEFNDTTSNIFDPLTIEQESSFTTIMIDENQHAYNATCRLWKPTEIIRIICDANFFEKGSHSVKIRNQSFEYRHKYLINVKFYGEKDFTFKHINTYMPFEKERRYYNTYLKNYVSDLNIYYDRPLINADLSEEENIKKLYIKLEDNRETKYIGSIGILNFVLDYNDSVTNIFNASDIEEKTSFYTLIYIPNDIASVNCKLWKPINEKLNMFCKLSKNMPAEKFLSFYLGSSSFDYKGQKFSIIRNENESFTLYQYNLQLPFLYAGKQVLNIDENNKTYYLTFKIAEYNNEILFMRDSEGYSQTIILDECSVEGKELKCKIEKDIIEEYALYNGQKFFIYNKYSQDIIPSIYGIYINYPFSKKNISVEIVKLLEDNIDIGNFMAYGTNVTNITNLYSKKFSLTFSYENLECHLRKTIGIPLTLICYMNRDTYFSLKITNKIELNNINIKYNFVIQPTNNDEICSVKGEGGSMLFFIPKVLDFTLKETITVEFWSNNPGYIRSIRLSPFSNDLECSNIENRFQRCLVNIRHLRSGSNGYFYTYHTNHDGKSIIFYELSPFKVIFPEKTIYISINQKNNIDKIKLKPKDTAFVLVTDYIDKDKKFNSNDNINFIGTFKNNGTGLDLKANCRLLIPENDNLRLICKGNGLLFFYNSYFYLKYIKFTHNKYTIMIEQDNPILFEVYDNYYPLLYSDRQTININDNQTSYELKFKKESYRNEVLYIYGSNNNYAIFDNCQDNTTDITCKISKEKLEAILVKNNDRFKIAGMSDTLGVISYDNILDITINYENVQKQDIYLAINKVIGGVTETGIPVGLVTNVTEIPNFISAKFDEMKYFKKVSGRPLILFYNYSFEIDYNIQSNYTEETIINDIL